MVVRTGVRRWIIECENGTLITYRILRKDAEDVARWCDRVHPECKPHLITGVEYAGIPMRPLQQYND